MKKYFLVLLSLSLLSSCFTPPQLSRDDDPCTDSAYLALQHMPYDKMSEAQTRYFLQKESDCFTYHLEIAKYDAAEKNTQSSLIYPLAIGAFALLVLLVTGSK